jgi:hypothetical protein
VFKANKKSDEKVFAIKKISWNALDLSLLSEVLIQQKLAHQNIGMLLESV